MYNMNERNASLFTIIKQAVSSGAKNLRVAMPAIIEKYDSDAQTVVCQCAIREKLSRDGVTEEVAIPLLVDVPLVLPNAGGYGVYITPEKGDECLVIFSDLCIDAWWQSGGVQSQADSRRHDLSDAFAILGTWSQPNKPMMPLRGLRMGHKAGESSVEVNDKGVKISGLKGVSVGSDDVGTEEEPLFNVGYKSVFKEQVRFDGGISFDGTIEFDGVKALTVEATELLKAVAAEISGGLTVNGTANLNGGIAPKLITDLNDVKVSGLYRYEASAENRPTNLLGGVMLVISHGDYVFQLVCADSDTIGDNLFIRQSGLNGWSRWYTFGNEYHTDETPCGTWIDGRTVYRRVLTDVVMTNSTTTISLAGWGITQPIKLYGMISVGGSWHPIPSYYSSTYHAYARFDNVNQLTLHGMSGMTGGFIVIEYLKD